MKFDPAAGALKNVNSERAVPLRPEIVASGFLEFVASQCAGPLFTGLANDRFGNRGASGTRIISGWVRGLGISDVRLSPSHSWRHRFATLGRRYGLALDLVDVLPGTTGRRSRLHTVSFRSRRSIESCRKSRLGKGKASIHIFPFDSLR